MTHWQIAKKILAGRNMMTETSESDIMRCGEYRTGRMWDCRKF